MDKQRLRDFLAEKTGQCKILVVGDIMLDKYYYGEVTRISGEAPVPITRVESSSEKLGGGANIAYSLAVLGCKVSIAGFVGKDSHCESLVEKFNHYGIDASGLIYTDRPTTTKVRIMSGNQQMFRLDFEAKQDIELQDMARFEQYIGEKFTGVIINVTHFGLFIKLPQFGVDGLLYCGSFKNYANYNSERGTLSVDGKVYALGMEIQVVVFAIDLEQRKISFVRPEDLSKKELLGLIKERDYLLSREQKTKRKEIKSTHEILAEIDDESMSRVAKNEDISIRNAH